MEFKDLRGKDKFTYVFWLVWTSLGTIGFLMNSFLLLFVAHIPPKPLSMPQELYNLTSFIVPAVIILTILFCFLSYYMIFKRKKIFEILNNRDNGKTT